MGLVRNDAPHPTMLRSGPLTICCVLVHGVHDVLAYCGDQLISVAMEVVAWDDAALNVQI